MHRTPYTVIYRPPDLTNWSSTQPGRSAGRTVGRSIGSVVLRGQLVLVTVARRLTLPRTRPTGCPVRPSVLSTPPSGGPVWPAATNWPSCPLPPVGACSPRPPDSTNWPDCRSSPVCVYLWSGSPVHRLDQLATVPTAGRRPARPDRRTDQLATATTPPSATAPANGWPTAVLNPSPATTNWLSSSPRPGRPSVPGRDQLAMLTARPPTRPPSIPAADQP